jgi:preprotein translocase subunit SecD
MRERNLSLLAGIVILTLVAGWIDWPANPGIHLHVGPVNIDREIKIHQGLDLQGGLQVLLQADVPEGEKVDADALRTAKVIVENRVNGLGVTEPLVQLQGDRRIIVELPGIKDPELAIGTIRETGLLEFIDAGYTFLEPGTVVKTTYGGESDEELATLTPTVTPTATEEPTVQATETMTTEVTSVVETTPATEEPTVQATETVTTETTSAVETTPAPGETPTAKASPTPSPTPLPTERVYTTILTGKHLKAEGTKVEVDFSQGKAEPIVAIEFNQEGTPIFAQFTATHQGQYLAIILDKKVISCPVIKQSIPSGQAVISGDFTEDAAKSLAIQLRYGALPIPLRVETTRTIGPTLGQESVQKSLIAGAIGLSAVLLFMLIYYRLPGFLADLALIIYALLNLAVFKLLPVTLTLPGITGFLLSTGMAVDANILIFERMKEELRAGRTLDAAIGAGFNRAWTAIRDSQISTLIVCAILYFFGSNFGASIVKGFAVTLAIGTVINIFTAITVTRTFILFVFNLGGEALRGKKELLGI